MEPQSPDHELNVSAPALNLSAATAMPDDSQPSSQRDSIVGAGGLSRLTSGLRYQPPQALRDVSGSTDTPTSMHTTRLGSLVSATSEGNVESGETSLDNTLRELSGKSPSQIIRRAAGATSPSHSAATSPSHRGSLSPGSDAKKKKRTLLENMAEDVNRLAETELAEKMSAVQSVQHDATRNTLRLSLVSANDLAEEDRKLLDDIEKQEEVLAAAEKKVEAERKARADAMRQRQDRNEMILNGIRDCDFSTDFVQMLQSLTVQHALDALKLYYKEGHHKRHREMVRKLGKKWRGRKGGKKKHQAELESAQKAFAIEAGGSLNMPGASPTAAADTDDIPTSAVDHEWTTNAKTLKYGRRGSGDLSLTSEGLRREQNDRRRAKITDSMKVLTDALAKSQRDSSDAAHEAAYLEEYRQMKRDAAAQAAREAAESARVEREEDLRAKREAKMAALAAQSPRGSRSSKKRQSGEPHTTRKSLRARPRTPPEGTAEKRTMLADITTQQMDAALLKGLIKRSVEDERARSPSLATSEVGTLEDDDIDAVINAALTAMGGMPAMPTKDSSRPTSAGGLAARGGVGLALAAAGALVSDDDDPDEQESALFSPRSPGTRSMIGDPDVEGGEHKIVWRHFFKSPVELDAKKVQATFLYFGKLSKIQFYAGTQRKAAPLAQSFRRGSRVGYDGNGSNEEAKPSTSQRRQSSVALPPDPVVCNSGREGVVMYRAIGGFGRAATKIDIDGHEVLISAVGRVEEDVAVLDAAVDAEELKNLKASRKYRRKRTVGFGANMIVEGDDEEASEGSAGKRGSRGAARVMFTAGGADEESEYETDTSDEETMAGLARERELNRRESNARFRLSDGGIPGFQRSTATARRQSVTLMGDEKLEKKKPPRPSIVRKRRSSSIHDITAFGDGRNRYYGTADKVAKTINGFNRFVRRSRDHDKSVVHYPDRQPRHYSRPAKMGMLTTRGQAEEQFNANATASLQASGVLVTDTFLAKNMQSSNLNEELRGAALPKTARCGATMANKLPCDTDYVRPVTRAASTAWRRAGVGVNRKHVLAVKPPVQQKPTRERMAPEGGNYMTFSSRSKPPTGDDLVPVRRPRKVPLIPLPPLPDTLPVPGAFVLDEDDDDGEYLSDQNTVSGRSDENQLSVPGTAESGARAKPPPKPKKATAGEARLQMMEALTTPDGPHARSQLEKGAWANVALASLLGEPGKVMTATWGESEAARAGLLTASRHAGSEFFSAGASNRGGGGHSHPGDASTFTASVLQNFASTLTSSMGNSTEDASMRALQASLRQSAERVSTTPRSSPRTKAQPPPASATPPSQALPPPDDSMADVTPHFHTEKSLRRKPRPPRGSRGGQHQLPPPQRVPTEAELDAAFKAQQLTLLAGMEKNILRARPLVPVPPPARREEALAMLDALDAERNAARAHVKHTQITQANEQLQDAEYVALQTKLPPALQQSQDSQSAGEAVGESS